MKTKDNLYLILTIVFAILSVIGIFFLFQIFTSNTDDSDNTSTTVSSSETISSPTPLVTTVPTASESSKTAQKTSLPSAPNATSTPVPTKVLSPTPTPTLSFKTEEDYFSVSYSTKRKLYEDTESSGNRYTFYLSSGNFAIHVGLNGQWSWSNPEREFSSDFTVSGQNTFVYETSVQKIIDFQYQDKNYTIQCVHNGIQSLKSECDDFIESFKFL